MEGPEVFTTGILPEMVVMTNKNQYQKGDRLFYEIGYKINHKKGYGDNWVRTGTFIEVKYPERMIREDTYLDKPDYLRHHNFMLIKNTENERANNTHTFMPTELSHCTYSEPQSGRAYKEQV